MRAAQTFQNKPTDHLRNWGFPSRHYPIGSSEFMSRCGRHGLSNILKQQATFLYSIYHQRAGKTNLFHMRGGRFHAGNTLCTFKEYCLPDQMMVTHGSLLTRAISFSLILPILHAANSGRRSPGRVLMAGQSRPTLPLVPFSMLADPPPPRCLTDRTQGDVLPAARDNGPSPWGQRQP